MRLPRHPFWTLIVLGLWLLLAGGATPGHAVFGLVLGLVLPALAARWLPQGPRLRRPWLLAPYALLVLWDILRASLVVSRLVLFQAREDFRPVWISVPLDLDRPGAVALLAATVTLTPGTLSADLSTDGRSLLVHCLHAPDPDAVADDIRTRYAARIRRIFG